jgi:hypothetical protein
MVRAPSLAGTLGRMDGEAGPDTAGADLPGEEPGLGRIGPDCSHCGGVTRFAGGVSTHDLWAERFVCGSCGRETFRSFGRGSVS